MCVCAHMYALTCFVTKCVLMRECAYVSLQTYRFILDAHLVDRVLLKTEEDAEGATEALEAENVVSVRRDVDLVPDAVGVLRVLALVLLLGHDFVAFDAKVEAEIGELFVRVLNNRQRQKIM